MQLLWKKLMSEIYVTHSAKKDIMLQNFKIEFYI